MAGYDSDSKTKTVYIEMSNPIYDQISKRVRESFPKSCICWIEEVQNPILQKSYDELKLKIGNEELLFHVRGRAGCFELTQTGDVHQRPVE